MTTKITDTVGLEFIRDLRALRAKYPQCYIEAWTPGDYEMDWDNPSAIAVSERLYYDFDASVGTNWETVQAASAEPK